MYHMFKYLYFCLNTFAPNSPNELFSTTSLLHVQHVKIILFRKKKKIVINVYIHTVVHVYNTYS